MQYITKTITLKDGRTAIFRAPDPVRDTRAMIDCLKATAAETEFLSRTPAECDVSEEKEKAFLENTLRAENAVMIVCEVDGKLAGNCQIVFETRAKKKHRATVMIAVLQKYWGFGIGTAMFREMIALAREKGTEQLELSVVEGNDRAIALYRKMGFETVGMLPDAFRLGGGASAGEIWMRKVLSYDDP